MTPSAGGNGAGALGFDDTGFVVSLERFSGPLDLLLHLIRHEEIDIWDIPIARIADQFLAVIASLGLNEAAEYLEMAARLLRIKAQMLLPRRGDQEPWEDPRHELVRRLLEYQQIREVVDWMSGSARRRAERHGRGWLAPAPEIPLPPPVFDLAELIQALERVLALIPDPIMYRIAPRPLDVEGAQQRVLAWLEERGSFGLGELLGQTPSVIDILSALVALLELARRGTCTVTQPAAFAPVMIDRGTAYQAA
ncbi:MAG TPA: ScpA family protein [Gemmatimonadales bacterium]|jgi:segregation and condensation protein A